LKELSEDQLSELEAMAKLMLSISDIAIILEVDEHAFRQVMEDKQADPWKRFQSGRMKSIAEVRKSIFDLAANGSSPAQTEAMKLIRDAMMEDI